MLAVALAIAGRCAGRVGQGPVYQAVDDLSGRNTTTCWQPGTDVTVQVQVGDTVTWRYDGTILAHNDPSRSPSPCTCPASVGMADVRAARLLAIAEVPRRRDLIAVRIGGRPRSTAPPAAPPRPRSRRRA